MIGILDTETFAEGLAELSRLDPVMAQLIAQGAQPALRKREPGFEGLARIVIGQQVSVASADAIWARLVGRLGPLAPATIEAHPDEAFKACGLSAPKIRTLRAVGDAISNGLLQIDELGEMPVERAHATLTKVKGIGPWTADIYLMFCLRHSDAFAAGDLALQEAAKLTYNLTVRPSISELISLAEQWRPWRAVAATVLWAYYNLERAQPPRGADAKPSNKALRKTKPEAKTHPRKLMTLRKLRGIAK